jgi:hypothetical protein
MLIPASRITEIRPGDDGMTFMLNLPLKADCDGGNDYRK